MKNLTDRERIVDLIRPTKMTIDELAVALNMEPVKISHTLTSMYKRGQIERTLEKDKKGRKKFHYKCPEDFVTLEDQLRDLLKADPYQNVKDLADSLDLPITQLSFTLDNMRCTGALRFVRIWHSFIYWLPEQEKPTDEQIFSRYSQLRHKREK